MGDIVATPIVIDTTPVKARNRPDKEDLSIEVEGLDLASYRGSYGKPYVVDYFGIDDLYNVNEDISAMADDITEHLIDKSDGAPLVYIAKSMLNRMSQEMNLQETDAPLFKLKKVSKYIKILKTQELLNKQKELIMADIVKTV